MTQDSLSDILKTAEHKMTTAVEILSRDLGSVRTGRATPALLDRIQVDYYGSPTPINGVANISAPDPRMASWFLDGPDACWTCRWANVDTVLAASADSGDAAAVRRLEVRLRDEALLLPLWRPTAVVAWRVGLSGVRVNGYASSAAWNAYEWWRAS